MSEVAEFKKCSVCKVSIPYNQKYYLCSVSTCNSQRTGLSFCSVACFERHLPGARHRDAAAIETQSPQRKIISNSPAASNTSSASMSAAGAHTGAAARVGMQSGSLTSSSTPSAASGVRSAQTQAPSFGGPRIQAPREVLVIASRLKDFISAQSDFNTSQSVMDVLSDHLRILCERAIDEARAQGRKTVMDRDFDFLKEFSKRR